jgi:hypothetical protein
MNKPSLTETHPEIAAQAHGWDPTTVTFGVDGMRVWTCGLEHVWSASPNARTGGQVHISGCPYCTNKKVLVGFNDLAATHPEIAEQAHGWDPTTVTRGSSKRLEWECSLGHTWFTRLDNRTKPNGTGCPGCYAMTFDEMTQRPLKFRDDQRKYT